MMGNTMTKKCEGCKQSIVIDVDNIKDVVLFKNKYYHKDCFIEVCNRKSQNKRCSPDWKVALENLNKYERDAVVKTSYTANKDKLNRWLLEHYNIIAVPGTFWTLLDSVHKGEYKGKSKALDILTIYKLWVWGQRNLDNIAKQNKMRHTGPQRDSDRLRYDLAILISKYPLFVEEQERLRAKQAEVSRNLNQTKIDYSKLSRKTKDDDVDDLLDLLNEIF